MNKEHEPNRVRFQVPGQALTQGAAGRRDGEPRLPRPALSLAAPQAPAPRGSTNGGERDLLGKQGRVSVCSRPAARLESPGSGTTQSSGWGGRTRSFSLRGFSTDGGRPRRPHSLCTPLPLRFWNSRPHSAASQPLRRLSVTLALLGDASRPHTTEEGCGSGGRARSACCLEPPRQSPPRMSRPQARARRTEL